ncbi:hypothetical protein [Chengkuizengella axinellae]|uniref:Uncharacterized protein n=1 Tax=Chengkuizengella axinellae TaxID=3064388 RepID=A0ABT9IX05_9BACL|nr:hypothetical protein [Chengkuizengella sp. 2205SS18-9]MDP5273904.1 hypothetical protein [Chengkuizengella sp. 2205SS18-9]
MRTLSWLSIIIIVGVAFVPLYIFTFIFSGFSYMVISDVPADRSWKISWIYYGILFSIIPYYTIGSILSFIKNKNKHVLAIVSLFTIFIVEKVGFVLFGLLVAKGFPTSWYGEDFPNAGFRLLSEEFPFYSQPIVYYYIIIGTIVGYMFLYAGLHFQKSKLYKKYGEKILKKAQHRMKKI